METETRLIVESLALGYQSEIRLSIPVEQFAGMTELTVGAPGSETTYRILSAETVPVEKPATREDTLDRVTAQLWSQIQATLEPNNVVVKEWNELAPGERAAIREAVQDAVDELEEW